MASFNFMEEVYLTRLDENFCMKRKVTDNSANETYIEIYPTYHPKTHIISVHTYVYDSITGESKKSPVIASYDGYYIIRIYEDHIKVLRDNTDKGQCIYLAELDECDIVLFSVEEEENEIMIDFTIQEKNTSDNYYDIVED